MITETKLRVNEWVTSPKSCFLLGAGCSKCAGKLLIGDLTKKVLASLDPDIDKEFKRLKKIGTRTPTIEDLINYLIRNQCILQTLEDTSVYPLKASWVDKSLLDIKSKIVETIIDDWIESPTHANFLRCICRTRSKDVRDIFTLNYDTVIESTLDHLRFHYIDGFRGSRNGWFDPLVFDEDPVSDPYFRIYKLHGSINWCRESSGHVRRTIVSATIPIKDPVVVYPSEQKYLQTQFGIYETLMERFRKRLQVRNSNNYLVTIGYSFNDEHINEAIIDAIQKNNNLTAIAFVGRDPDSDYQQKNFESIEERCDHRFNAYIGNSFHVGNALDPICTKDLLKEELWKFENLVNYITGSAL